MFEDRFFVYRMIRPTDLAIIYVGQGQDRRLKEQIRILNKGSHGNKELQEEFNKIRNENKEIIFDIYAKHITEQESLNLEIKLIAEYGRLDLGKGTLYNKTDGGRGPTNAVLTKKQIDLRKKVWLGRNHTGETKVKIGVFHKRKIVSEETKEKQRIAALNRKPKSPETIEKLRIIGYARIQSEETKEKCRQNALKMWEKRKEKIEKQQQKSKEFFEEYYSNEYMKEHPKEF